MLSLVVTAALSSSGQSNILWLMSSSVIACLLQVANGHLAAQNTTTLLTESVFALCTYRMLEYSADMVRWFELIKAHFCLQSRLSCHVYGGPGPTRSHPGCWHCPRGLYNYSEDHDQYLDEYFWNNAHIFSLLVISGLIIIISVEHVRETICGQYGFWLLPPSSITFYIYNMFSVLCKYIVHCNV